MSQDKMAWYALQNLHEEVRLGTNGPLMLAVLLAAGPSPWSRPGTPCASAVVQSGKQCLGDRNPG
jgi:hypothetical protein